MEREFMLEDIGRVAAELLQHWKEPGAVGLYGPMGAGKTTLVHALCDALGVKDAVSSPTFSIINEYGAGGSAIYHIDCYRLNSEAEAIDAGVEECLYSGAWCFVEWPEKIPGLLPPETRRMELSVVAANNRRLKMISPE
ncbi:MAG: tRNA (adenosine(37)-N6)-threonylcarbamoyltransferase complex ATPase subunit type 1 TsaE [Flavihumibacter sp.]